MLVRIKGVVFGHLHMVQSRLEGTGFMVAAGLLVALIGMEQLFGRAAKMLADMQGIRLSLIHI